MQDAISRKFVHENVPISSLPDKVRITEGGKKEDLSATKFKIKLEHDVEGKQLSPEALEKKILKEKYHIVMNDLDKRQKIMNAIKSKIKKK